MSKLMSAQEYHSITKSDKLEIESYFFGALKEHVEELFPFLTIEKIEFTDYWDKVEQDIIFYDRLTKSSLSSFVLSDAKTFIRLPSVTNYIEEGYGNINFSDKLYGIQKELFGFFRLPNSVMGAKLAWGDEDYTY